MRKSRLVCLLALICGGLALTYGIQKKPGQRPNAVEQANPRMQAEKNKVPVQQLFNEMWTHGRYELQGQVFAPGCIVHFGNRTLRLHEAVAEGKGLRNGAPDLVMSINQISVNGNMVTVSWTARGTHTHPGAGMKPTGRQFKMQGRSQFRVENGKIVEAFNEEYRPELFRQLGVSKTRAAIFFAGERILAALDPIIPDRVYALLF